MNADRSREFLAASRVALVVRSVVVARHAGYRGCCYNGRSPSKENTATSPVAILEPPATTIAPTVPSQRLWRHALFETKTKNRNFRPGYFSNRAASRFRADYRILHRAASRRKTAPSAAEPAVRPPSHGATAATVATASRPEGRGGLL